MGKDVEIFDRRHAREQELLVCCGRVRLEMERAERVKTILREPLDWDYLLNTARQHGIQMVFYRSLKSVCQDDVPPSILAQLKTEWDTLTILNLYLSQKLVGLLDLFELNQIRAVPFKGPVLTASVYGQLGLRPFADLDVFIRKVDLERTGDLLLAHGFRVQDQFDPEMEEEILDLKYHVHYVCDEDRCHLEIHWNIMSSFLLFAPDFGPIWNDLDRIDFLGTSVPTLARENQLLLLCIHGMKHMWKRLIWICDIAELIDSGPEMKWDQIISAAERIGSKRMLWLGLLLAEKMLGAKLPQAIAEQARSNRAVRDAAEQVYQEIFTDSAPVSSHLRHVPVNRIRQSLFYIRLRDRQLDKVRLLFLAYLTPRPADRKFLPLPLWLDYCYYLIRPIRLTGKLLLGMVGYHS